MEGMVVVFRGSGTGSGQFDPISLEQSVDIPDAEEVTDADKIRSLASLNSFDV